MKRHSESGFALLLIYAMAASIAIMLYMQLPKVAFEKQRDKEQMLIDRGEQYSRAIQLYVRKYSRFPADIQALENTQSIRFLRRRYKDPMTGKEEWREIHVGPGGVFTDSKVYGPKKDGDKAGPQTFITEMQQIGGNVNNGQAGVNLALRQRPSQQPGAPGDPNNTGQAPTDPNAPPGSVPVGVPGATPGGANYSGPVMVLPDGRVVPATPTGQPLPAAPQTGAQGQPPNGLPPGTRTPSGIGVQPGTASGTSPSQGGLPPGFQTQANAPPAAAANLINQLLTTPRPGGLNGLGQSGADPALGQTPNAVGTPVTGSLGSAQNNTGTPAGQTIGGGFAGVASKDEREGIKVYKDRTAYDEWEFVYDMTKDPTRAGGLPNTGQRPGQTGTNPVQNPVPGQSQVPIR